MKLGSNKEGKHLDADKQQKSGFNFFFHLKTCHFQGQKWVFSRCIDRKVAVSTSAVRWSPAPESLKVLICVDSNPAYSKTLKNQPVKHLQRRGPSIENHSHTDHVGIDASCRAAARRAAALCLTVGLCLTHHVGPLSFTQQLWPSRLLPLSVPTVRHPPALCRLQHQQQVGTALMWMVFGALFCVLACRSATQFLPMGSIAALGVRFGKLVRQWQVLPGGICLLPSVCHGSSEVTSPGDVWLSPHMSMLVFTLNRRYIWLLWLNVK